MAFFRDKYGDDDFDENDFADDGLDDENFGDDDFFGDDAGDEDLDEATDFEDIHDINIFLVGTGVIGNTLLTQIREQNPVLNRDYNVNVRVLGIANSRKMYMDENGIDLSNWRNLVETAGDDVDLQEFIDQAESMQVNTDNPFSDGVFVDCTASEKIVEYYQQAIESELHVVTPNKKAASGDSEILGEIRDELEEYDVEFLYETNVGAGLPVIRTLRDLIMTGDKIWKIEGVLSGTLSYIFNTFNPDMKFSDVVKEAKEKGYTEPDPRDDLNGMDVARKILILAREAGAEMELGDVEVQGLIPESAMNVDSVEDFFVELEKNDGEFAQKVAQANEQGKVLRYIAKFEGGKASIGLEAVGANHPFYSLSGSDNIISFTTERYRETPLVIKGPGAGAEVTAAGVFADILSLLK